MLPLPVVFILWKKMSQKRMFMEVLPFVERIIVAEQSFGWSNDLKVLDFHNRMPLRTYPRKL